MSRVQRPCVEVGATTVVGRTVEVGAFVGTDQALYSGQEVGSRNSRASVLIERGPISASLRTIFVGMYGNFVWMEEYFPNAFTHESPVEK